jgi:hypothetical protein
MILIKLVEFSTQKEKKKGGGGIKFDNSQADPNALKHERRRKSKIVPSCNSYLNA